jgi:hypothetical protein
LNTRTYSAEEMIITWKHPSAIIITLPEYLLRADEYAVFYIIPLML